MELKSSPAPKRSMLFSLFGSSFLGRSNVDARRIIAPSGRLNQNIYRQPNASTIQPPILGPTIIPMGKILEKRPI
jgi:hypothetical protein